jgi:hypothetical protein
VFPQEDQKLTVRRKRGRKVVSIDGTGVATSAETDARPQKAARSSVGIRGSPDPITAGVKEFMRLSGLSRPTV